MGPIQLWAAKIVSDGLAGRGVAILDSYGGAIGTKTLFTESPSLAVMSRAWKVVRGI